jgi:CheY-like chemotaxis protein
MNARLHCVLIIDDDEPTNFFNQMLLEKSGCVDHIQIAQSGQEALDYLTNSDRFTGEQDRFPCPALILLDINMPAMNGWEFLDKYKEMGKEHKGKIIVVMLTTSLHPEDVKKAEEMPEISGVENKPLTAENLNRILLKYFGCGKTRETTQ